MSMNPIASFAVAASASGGQAPALWARDTLHSYGTLARTVAAVQALLQQQPVLPARIGVVTGDDLPTYAALLAILGLGRAYVPINRHHPAERNQYVLEDAGLSLILASEPHTTGHALPTGSYTLLSLDNLPDTQATVQAQPVQTTDEAYVLFTSGSTGRPKGVPISHGALAGFLEAAQQPDIWQLGPQDRFLQMFDLTFDLSVYSYLLPLTLGASTYIVPAEGISFMHIATLLEEEALTVALMVPSVLAYLQPYFDELELPQLRYSLFCGEALPHSTTTAWQQCCPTAHIDNVYGPTEATIFCLHYRWQQEQSEAESHNGIVPIGRPMLGVETAILDETGQPATEGELCLAGRQLTTGYLHNPERNAQAFLIHNGTRYYRTGDRVTLSPQGNYLYLGRLDNQVKIDGYRVELGEIEHHVRSHTGLAQVAVVPQTEGSNTVLHLYLEQYAHDTATLRSYLTQVLPPYMQPRYISVLDHLPLNVNGKIDRKALAQMPVNP